MASLQMIRLSDETLQAKLRDAQDRNDGTPDALRLIRKIQDAIACKMPRDNFPPGLPSALWGAWLRAREQGLYLSQFNSGSRFNSSNGIRVFSSPDRGYFEGSHIAHLRTLEDVNIFLDGFSASLRARKPWLED